jgi:hypothetical protein
VHIGITGHQKLKDPQAWDWVRSELDNFLSQTSRPLIGITSLAIGADQLFAKSALQHGGKLNVIVPFEGYEKNFSEGPERNEYYRLLNAASKTEVLQKMSSDEENYYATGRRIVDLSDILLAIWDGKPAAGLGGTGDIVEYAHRADKSIIHINPLLKTVTQY